MEITSDILKRFFSGKFSRRDYNTVHRFFATEKDEKYLRKLLEKHWLEYEPGEPEESSDAYSVNALLHKIQHRIYLEDSKKTASMSLFFRNMQRVAAILFIPLLLTFATYLFVDGNSKAATGYAEIVSPMSGKTRFTLPDGSTGFLNNGSSLKYPLNFTRNRKTELVGEAWFNVKKTGSRFHVYTKTLNIEVMGTSFNIMAYDNDNTEEVTLQSGTVKVSAKDGSELAILTPNQQLATDTCFLQPVIQNIDANQYSSWTEGKLAFRNESLDKVVKRLCRWYNVDCTIADKELTQYTFHATFIDENLDEVLKLLSLTTPITCKEEKRTMKPDGTREKRKIILTLDMSRISQFRR